MMGHDERKTVTWFQAGGDLAAPALEGHFGGKGK